MLAVQEPILTPGPRQTGVLSKTTSATVGRRYLEPVVKPPRVQLFGIPKGYRGTQRTVAHIQLLIRDGAKDFYVRQ